jgi:hypothetical protein
VGGEGSEGGRGRGGGEVKRSVWPVNRAMGTVNIMTGLGNTIISVMNMLEKFLSKVIKLVKVRKNQCTVVLLVRIQRPSSYPLTGGYSQLWHTVVVPAR